MTDVNSQKKKKNIKKGSFIKQKYSLKLKKNLMWKEKKNFELLKTMNLGVGIKLL